MNDTTPSHYDRLVLQPFHIMRANFSYEEYAGFLQGCILKRLLRWKHKDGVTDLQKMKVELEELIAFELAQGDPVAQPRHVYTVVNPDGSTVVGYFIDIMVHLQRNFEVHASRDLIQKRLLVKVGRRADAVDLVKPANSPREAGAARWLKEGAPCKSHYDGVEGFDYPVSSRDVWKAWVRSQGQLYPGRETIRKHLKEGLRSKADILEVKKQGSREYHRPSVGSNTPLKANPTPWRETPLSQQSVKLDIDSPDYRCPELPPMEEWKGWDAGFYRRVPL